MGIKRGLASRGELRATARLQGEMLNAVGQAVVATDIGGRVAYWNRAAENLWGWSPGEAKGRPLDDFVFDGGTQTKSALTRGESSRFTESIARHRHGHTIPVEHVQTSFVEDARRERVIHVFSDLRERNAATHALDQAHARLQRLVDSNIIGILIFSANGDVIEANQYYLDLLGVSREETRNGTVNWAAATPPEYMPAYHHAMQEMREHGVCTPYEKEYLRRDGSRVWVLVVDTTLPGPTDQYAAIVLDITDRKRAEARLAYQALHDGLTGLPNRSLLHAHVQQHMARLDYGEGSPMALLLLDLDRFKEVNDTLGHHVGDVLLQQIGQRLQASVRSTDLVARLGGDEFAVVLPNTDAAGAAQVARTLVRVLQDPIVFEGRPIAVGASIGIAVAPEDGQDANDLLRCADVAMYQAKRTGSAVSRYRASEDEHRGDRLALLGELRSAIDHNELVLQYQPKVDLRDGLLVGVEALVRWQHPRRGLVPPGEFIPLAEETGLIDPLSRWVLEAALKQYRAWRSGNIDIPVAVNLSRRTLHDPRLPETIAELLSIWNVPASALVLEITESSLMADPARASENLSQLRALGVRISIDDFGTGYSSLASLKNLPVDELKIDQSFVQAIATDASSLAIVRTIIDLADALKLRVVAEGVEDLATLNLLADLGCEVAQGYFLCRPIAAVELEVWVARVAPSWLSDAAEPSAEDQLHDRIRGHEVRLAVEAASMARQEAAAALLAHEERKASDGGRLPGHV